MVTIFKSNFWNIKDNSTIYIPLKLGFALYGPIDGVSAFVQVMVSVRTGLNQIMTHSSHYVLVRMTWNHLISACHSETTTYFN